VLQSALPCVTLLEKEQEVIVNHIHDALAQVRRMQELVLEKRRFQGYSGKARILSGTAALMGTIAMGSRLMPIDPLAHLIGWGVVLAVGVMLNYFALAYWFLFDPQVRRNPAMLKPAIDALPALGSGAAFTVALIVAEQFNLLFGMWMSLYGLAQVAYRRSLPQGVYIVGLCYLVCGAWCLLAPGITFTNPWPMGVVFFAGEWAGGIILYCGNHRKPESD